MRVFSGNKMSSFLRQRKMGVPDLHREMVKRGCMRSQPTLYSWGKGSSIPNANDLELLSYILRCDKDDFYEETIQ